MSIERLLQLIDMATDPKNMSLAEARNFLEQLVIEVDSRIDGIIEDMISAGEKP